MSGFTTHLAAVCSLLNHEKARYVLVGERALQLWGSSHDTRDIGILIEPTAENAGRVLRALNKAGFAFAAEELAAEVASKKVTVIGAMPRVDILTVAWKIPYHQAAPDAHHFALEGVAIPAASIDHLIASKQTGRRQDAADIEVLEEIRKSRGTGEVRRGRGE